MFEEMLGAFLALYGCDSCVLRGYGGVEEAGRPGHVAQTARTSRTARTCGPTAGVRAGVAWQVQAGGFGWLMFEVFGGFMDLYGCDFLALRGWGCVDG